MFLFGWRQTSGLVGLLGASSEPLACATVSPSSDLASSLGLDIGF